MNAAQAYAGGRLSGSTGAKIFTLPAQSSAWTSTASSTGVFQITLSTPYPGGTNYTVVATPIYNSTSTLSVTWASTSSSVITLYVRDQSGTAQGYAVNFLVF